MMDEETLAKLELYQGVQKMYEEEVEDLKGRDKEAIEERIESCRRLIQQIYDKENPTKNKGMYK